MKNNLTYREFTKLFVSFLAKHNALKQYKRNIKKYRPNQFKDWYTNINPLLSDSIIHDIENDDLFSIITHAFRWSETKEGFNFWSNLHYLWAHKVSNIKIIKEKIP